MSDSASQIRASATGWRSDAAITALVVVLVLTLIRIVVLAISFINLGEDEAQYWAWSRELAFGYFSKPPMIAWLIAGTTSICGNGEACVRVSAPLLHAGTAMIIFYLARRLYDERIALWSAIAYITLPAVWLSSGLMSTDVPLMFFWAGALLGLVYLIDAKRSGNAKDALKFAAITGALIGLGFLSKYAMVYFLICMSIFSVFSRDARKALLSPAGLVLFVVAAAVFTPNLIWNATTGFATFEHTAANANWGAKLFNPRKLSEFLLGQIGIFGPILTIMFMFGIMTLKRRLTDDGMRSDLMLICFSLPILAIMLAQSFISRANANWTAPAYVAAVIVTVAWLFRGPGMMIFGRFRTWGRFFFNCSLIIHLVGGIALYSWITIPGAIELFRLENTFKRVRGWDTLAVRLDTLTADRSFKAIVTDDRAVISALTYYARRSNLPIVIFDIDGRPGNEFELKHAYTPDLGDPVLLVTANPNSKVLEQFELSERIETFRMEQGGPKHTDFHLYRLAAFKRRIAG